MPREQILMGAALCIVCLAGAWHSQWLIEHTRKGRRLAESLGARRALWLVRVLLLAGAMFGALLALGIVNPVRW